MNTILILCLSIISVSYISGISGVLYKTFNLKHYYLCYSVISFALLFLNWFILKDIPYYIVFPIDKNNFCIRFSTKAFVFSLIFFSAQTIVDYLLILFFSKIIKSKIKFKKSKFASPITLLIGTLEEFCYRFVILYSLIYLMDNIYLAFLISSSLYVLNHFHMIKNSNLKLYFIISKFIFGLLLCYLSFYYGLIFSIIMHAMYNLYLMFLLPILSRFSLKSNKGVL